MKTEDRLDEAFREGRVFQSRRDQRLLASAFRGMRADERQCVEANQRSSTAQAVA